MGIDLIPNQQFIFDHVDDACNPGDRLKYCQLVADNDYVGVQFKQTPCGIESHTEVQSLCNPDLNIIVGSEIITNGGFTGSATGWTLNNVTYGTNNVIFSNVPVADLHQSSASFIAGKTFQVTYTITSISTGGVRASVNGVGGATISATGTYTELIVAGSIGTVFKIAGKNTDAVIDSVSVKEASYNCWTTSNDNINVFDGSACHLVGASSVLAQTGTLTNAILYQIKITIANRTQGDVTIDVGGTPSDPITSNGEQVIYLEAIGADINITMSSDFDGCILSVFAYPLEENFGFFLYDLNDNLIADLLAPPNFGDHFFIDNYFFLGITLQGGTIFDTNGDLVPYGCYKLKIFDPCNSTYYESNCLSWQQSQDCTTLLKGTCDSDFDLGFCFQQNADVHVRLRVLQFNPLYQQEEEDYLYSDGTRAITYSQSEKYKTFLFDYVDEVTHDTINAIINCDHVTFDGVEYYIKKGQYSPDWNKDGRQKLAQSRIEGKIKDRTIFNKNCS